MADVALLVFGAPAPAHSLSQEAKKDLVRYLLKGLETKDPKMPPLRLSTMPAELG